MVDINDLSKAYRRTDLKKSGITLLQAMKVPHLLRCLERIASTAAPSSTGDRPTHSRPYIED